MMKSEEKGNSEEQVEAVDTPQPTTAGAGAGANWYKSGGIGLIGGVIGALIITALAPFSQQNTVMEQISAQIERQAERIDEAKSDREKEFSRVFEAISELNEKSRTHEATIETLKNQVSQTTRMQGNQATKLQDLTQTTAGLSKEMEGLKDLLAEFEARPQPSALATDQADERREVAALKAQISSLEEKVETISQLTQRWEEEEQQWEEEDTNAREAAKEAAEKLTDMILKQKKEIEDLQIRVHALMYESRVSNVSLVKLIAAQSLKRAVDRGGSYREEWEIFSPYAPLWLPLDALKKYADSGLPNNVELSRRFARLADEIAAVENTLPEGAGLTDQLLHQGSRLYSARPVGDVEGDGAAAIAARMEVALAEGDFTRFWDEYRTLPQEAKTLMADFMDIFHARKDADRLLSRFIADALQEDYQQYLQLQQQQQQQHGHNF